MRSTSPTALGGVVAIDRERLEVVARMPATPGIGMLRISPDGRWGFVLDREKSLVHVFDVTTNRLRHAIPVGTRPDQVTITEDYAYVRLLGSDRVDLIGLDALDAETAPAVIEIPAGWQLAGEAEAGSATASPIAPLPEGGGVLIANPADRMIYYYMEGMNAPMGTFRTFGRAARAVIAVDKGLRETAPGLYASSIRLPRAGRYDVAFLLDTPRIVQCFDIAVRPDPTQKAQGEKAPLSVEYLVDGRAVPVGESFDLRFKLLEGAAPVGSGVGGVRVLTVLAPGIWQRRLAAEPLGDGTFEVPLALPRKGLYYVYIEAPSLGVRFRELPYVILRTEEDS